MTPRERLADARLYLVCDARPRAFLDAALRGGADIVQLRDKTLDDDGAGRRRARVPRRRRRARRAVHPQRPPRPRRGLRAPTACTSARTTARPPRRARLVGPDRIVGRSTHAPAQADAADADPDVDYLAVGPVHATPTKPGRPAAGLDYVAYAARTSRKPWFAIGGLDAGHAADGRRARRPPRGRRAGDHRGAPTPRRGRARCAPRWRCPLGQRSRKRRASAAPREARRAARAGDGDWTSRGYARSRARADDVRAGLEPLAPGERPLAVTIAAVVAALLARRQPRRLPRGLGRRRRGARAAAARSSSARRARRRRGRDVARAATGRCSASRCCSACSIIIVGAVRCCAPPTAQAVAALRRRDRRLRAAVLVPDPGHGATADARAARARFSGHA